MSSLHKQECKVTSRGKPKNPKTRFRILIHSKDSKVNYIYRLTTSLASRPYAFHSSILYLSVLLLCLMTSEKLSATKVLSADQALSQLFLHTVSTSHLKILSCLIIFDSLSPYLLYWLFVF